MSKLPEDHPKVAFWSNDDGDEDLQHEDINDAIEEYLDRRAPSPPAKTLEEFWDSIPEEVTVYGYARRAVTEDDRVSLSLRTIDRLIEMVEDELGGRDQPSLPFRDDMKIAARTFVDAVLAEYTPWRCDVVCERTIDAHAWVKEHAADWLEGLVAS